MPAPPTEQDILAALNRVNAMLTEGNAPPIVTSRVVRIARAINDTLPRLRNLGLGSMEGYSVATCACRGSGPTPGPSTATRPP